MNIQKSGQLHGFLLSEDSSDTDDERDEHRDRRRFTSIDFPGATSTFAAGINSEGDITGTYVIGGVSQHGYPLSRGEFTSIDFPGSSLTQGFSINRRGGVVPWSETRS